MQIANLRPIDYALRDFLSRQFPQASAAELDLAALVSYQLAEGHLCLDWHYFKQHHRIMASALPALSTLNSAQLEQLLNNHALIDNQGAKPLVLQGRYLYLNRYFVLEKNISEAIFSRLNTDFYLTHAIESQHIRPVLGQLFPHSQSNDWQKIACTVAGKKGIGIITGGPGTGKTTTVVKLLALLQSLSTKPLTILLAAPTGKAAARLAESINNALRQLEQLNIPQQVIQNLPKQAKTLHQLLGYQAYTRHFRHHQDNPLIADLVVVDEASMIDVDMMQALLNALPSTCRLILLGDKNQLASVEAGRIMSDICQQADAIYYDKAQLDFLQQCNCPIEQETHPASSALSQQTVLLKTSWRAKDAAGILALADAVNQQNYPLVQQIFNQKEYQASLTRYNRASTQWLEEIKSHYATLHQQMQNMPENTDTQTLDNWAGYLLEQLSQWQLLSPLRQGSDGVEQLNLVIRQHLQNHLNANYQKLKSRFGLQENALPLFYPGEPILVTKNLYDLNVMNGDIGLALYHPQLGVRVAFIKGKSADNYQIQWIIPEQLDQNSQGAYAITVHQSQGSEYQRCMLYLPDNYSPVMSKELIYTAITRAKSHFILLESADSAQAEKVLKLCINNKTLRFSGLAERLHAGGNHVI